MAVEKLLGLTEEYKLAAMALIGRQKGYPKVPKIKRRKDWSWLHRNHFGNKGLKQNICTVHVNVVKKLLNKSRRSLLKSLPSSGAFIPLLVS